jgi:signal transduction histidine kinase
MIKLLDKPLKAFAIYAFLVLLGSIPVYFLMIDWIWIHEVNEHNRIVAQTTKKRITALHLSDREVAESMQLWNNLQPELKFERAAALQKDSTYNVYRRNIYIPAKGYDRFHGLVTYFEINGQAYRITIESNIEESYETIAAITAITVLFFIILLVGFIKLNKRISAKLWRPFYLTLDKIREFDLNSLQGLSFDPTGIAEFDEMNTSVNKLIESNVVVYRQQKEFIENASHELQTPLAIVQSKLDILFQTAAINDEQSELIEKIQNALSRVSRINKNLLLLAKIENQQFQDREKINMRESLEEILDLLSDFKGDKSIVLNVHAELQLEANKMLLEILLTNLLMNAIRHAEPRAQITVTLEADELKVANTGTLALDSGKLFKRFSSVSKQTPGSGLGLSIVREICNRYLWTIGYVYADNCHIFVVKFR